MSSFKKKEKRKNHYPGSGRNLEKLSPRRKLIREGNWLAFELTVTTVNELVPTAEFRLSISQLIPANWRPDFRPRLTEICRNRGEIGTRHDSQQARIPSSSFEYSSPLRYPIPKWNIPFPWVFESRSPTQAWRRREEVVSRTRPTIVLQPVHRTPHPEPRDLRKNCRVLPSIPIEKHELWNANTIRKFPPIRVPGLTLRQGVRQWWRSRTILRYFFCPQCSFIVSELFINLNFYF